MYSTSDFRNGLKILIDGIPFEVVYFQHVKPGKGGAFVRTKIKNLLNGAVLERTFRAGEKLDKPDLEDHQMQFLYADDDFHFMNVQTYEQVSLSRDVIGDAAFYLKENMEVGVLFFNGSVINVSLPNSVELKVAECEPGVKGDTVSGATKNATLETGAKVQVPLFVNEGDVLRIDTRSGGYIERA